MAEQGQFNDIDPEFPRVGEKPAPKKKKKKRQALSSISTPYKPDLWTRSLMQGIADPIPVTRLEEGVVITRPDDPPGEDLLRHMFANFAPMLTVRDPRSIHIREGRGYAAADLRHLEHRLLGENTIPDGPQHTYYFFMPFDRFLDLAGEEGAVWLVEDDRQRPGMLRMGRLTLCPLPARYADLIETRVGREYVPTGPGTVTVREALVSNLVWFPAPPIATRPVTANETYTDTTSYRALTTLVRAQADNPALRAWRRFDMEPLNGK